ncbi:hypothetical protein F2Q68_00016832 [Brassica cretica]|uniref:Uncharacterized protein n=1 Tax=Brassica cretica TaxID=69181 RepID=A0A8S9HJA2_BRACR|nr:hypothetical protein F2Q68_00016832 [Brassica cretica]
MVSQGPYSASLGETTTGTCWDFAFYRSEAGHYRVLVLHAASAEATIRLIKVLLVWMKIQVPDFTTLHVWSSSRVLHNLVPLLGDPRLSLLIMAPGRVPSVGLVPGRQVGVSSDDEPGGCAQCREGSSFHRLGESVGDQILQVVMVKFVLGVPQRFRWVNFVMSKEALRHSRNVARLPVSIIYDEYQKAKTRKRRPFYTPPPRLVRAASSVSGPSFVPPAGSEVPPARISPMAVHQRLLTELFFLRNQVQGMAFHRDQSVLRTRATARWELMKEWLEKKVDHWNPEEEYRIYLSWAEGVDQLMTRGPVQAATSGSAEGSRYSEDLSF